MKSVKLLLAALAMTFAMGANAQDGKWTVDIKFGSVMCPYTNNNLGFGIPGRAAGFGLGVGYQKNLKEFGDWKLVWDVASFDYAAPFNSPADVDFLAVRTGLRLFTPTFGGGNFRAYVNANPGYSCALWKEYTLYELWGNGVIVGYQEEEKMKAHHGFGLAVGAGIQYKEKFSIGYTLQYETAGKTKNHFATIGYTF